MPTSLTSIESICPIRMIAGVGDLTYIPLQTIHSAGEYYTIISDTGQILLSASGTWLRMPYMIDTASHSVTKEDSLQGPIYHHALSGFLPYWSPAVVSEMNKMSRMRFVAVVAMPGQAMNVFVGNTESGAVFDFDRQSGEAPGQRSGIQFSFTWDNGDGILYNVPV